MIANCQNWYENQFSCFEKAKMLLLFLAGSNMFTVWLDLCCRRIQHYIFILNSSTTRSIEIDLDFKLECTAVKF